MTFKKNVLVVLLSTLFIVLCAYLTRMNRDTLIYGLFIWIAGSIVSLSIEDMIRKWKEKSELLTWQYYVGIGLVLLADLTFLWTAETVEMKDFIIKIGIAIFLGFLGYFWFSYPYKNSVSGSEDFEIARWNIIAKKLTKEKIEAKEKIISKNLRYRFISDSLDSDLDFDKPIAFFEGECLTLDEISKIDTEVALEIAQKAARYIRMLIQEVE